MQDKSLQQYFKEINRYRLLKPEEEKELARRAKAGDAKARDILIKSNLRLVVSIAKHFMDRGLPLQDLIAEGNLGLMKAVEKFNPDEKCKFSTYASFWIRQAIKRALIDTVKTVRVPSYVVELIARWRDTANQLQARLGRTPTIQEIADKMGLSGQMLRLIRAAMRLSSSIKPPRTEEGPVSLDEIIEDRETERPDQVLEKIYELDIVRKMLNALDEREAKVLRLRYGLDDMQPRTLKEIGEEIGLSRERVRQIENEALRKLNIVLTEGPHALEVFKYAKSRRSRKRDKRLPKEGDTLQRHHPCSEGRGGDEGGSGGDSEGVRRCED